MNTLEQNLVNIFKYDNTNILTNVTEHKLFSFSKNNVFSCHLSISNTSSHAEIPVISRNIIVNHPTFTPDKSFIIPIKIRSQLQKKTFNGMMSICNLSLQGNICKVTNGKGDTYYIGKGIILNSEYKLLLLCTINIDMELVNNKIIALRNIVHVDPSVFSSPNDMVNRGIIKKIIPFYTSYSFPYYADTHLRLTKSESYNPKAKVIIDSLDDYIVLPKIPKYNENINDGLNNCLINNYKNIINTLYKS